MLGVKGMAKNRFQKQFISKEKLLEIYPQIQSKLTALKQSFDTKQIQDFEFCASYLLEFYKVIYPDQWTMGPSPLPFKSTYEDLNTLFQNNIRSLPFAVRDALGKWSTGQYPIRLYFEVPTSVEILKMQTEG